MRIGAKSLFVEPYETWTAAGTGRMLGGAAHFDVAYMLRTRAGSDPDHLGWLMLVFGVSDSKTPTPQPAPVGDSVD